jgi:hypothetical protein
MTPTRVATEIGFGILTSAGIAFGTLLVLVQDWVRDPFALLGLMVLPGIIVGSICYARFGKLQGITIAVLGPFISYWLFAVVFGLGGPL